MRALSDTPFGDALLLLVNVWVGSRRISFFVLTLALRSGERGRLARCLWPPAKGACERGVTLELGVRSRLRTIRRDAEWCDRDGRAPPIDSRVSRFWTCGGGMTQQTVALPESKELFLVWKNPRFIGAKQRTAQKMRCALYKLRRRGRRAPSIQRKGKEVPQNSIFRSGTEE